MGKSPFSIQSVSMPFQLALNDLQNLLVGAAGNALWAMLSYTGQKCVSAIRLATKSENQMDTIYQQSAEALAVALPVENERDRSRLSRFLASAEVEALARQYFSTKLLSDPGAFDPPSIRTEFNKLLSLYLDVSAQQSQPLSDILLPLLTQECDRLLNVAIENGALSAHEAKSAVRHNLGWSPGLRQTVKTLLTVR